MSTPIVPNAPLSSARTIPEQDWKESQEEVLTTGERAADRLRNGMGSWPFVVGFLIFMGLWVLANSLVSGWDPYPFILLNLFLSMLAGMQGAILLIAAKRQDAIASALARHDYETNVAAKTDIEVLLEINHRQLEMIAELHTLVSSAQSGNTGGAVAQSGNTGGDVAQSGNTGGDVAQSGNTGGDVAPTAADPAAKS